MHNSYACNNDNLKKKSTELHLTTLERILLFNLLRFEVIVVIRLSSIQDI